MEVKKIIITMGHPAHFHLFKNVVKELLNKKIEVKVVITQKDILENLLKNTNFQYSVLANRKKQENYFDKLKKIRNSTKEFLKIADIFKPDLMIGCMTQMGYVTFLRGIPSVFCGEDDINYTYMQYIITGPFVTDVCAPKVTNVGLFSYKKIAYNSYQKLAYLHPNTFIPDMNMLKEINTSNPYFIIRLVNLSAHHDVNITGFKINVLHKVIQLLEKRGTVYLTSEKILPCELQKYVIPISIENIHHALYFASLYIGDSQSMAVEAAMLGVPNIRFNDFVGKISVLEELEHTYGLTFGIKTSNPQSLYKKIEELLMMPDLKHEFQARRQRMLKDKIDVTAFFTWFIENYPKSKKIMRENPDYQYRFK
ncbi:MAG TPA: DUF354 domain-containing protein [Bacteroidales bacterium]|nr:DUF354 domain-containing protein [Bacteroidales bacterium]